MAFVNCCAWGSLRLSRGTLPAELGDKRNPEFFAVSPTEKSLLAWSGRGQEKTATRAIRCVSAAAAVPDFSAAEKRACVSRVDGLRLSRKSASWLCFSHSSERSVPASPPLHALTAGGGGAASWFGFFPSPGKPRIPRFRLGKGGGTGGVRAEGGAVSLLPGSFLFSRHTKEQSPREGGRGRGTWVIINPRDAAWRSCAAAPGVVQRWRNWSFPAGVLFLSSFALEARPLVGLEG